MHQREILLVGKTRNNEINFHDLNPTDTKLFKVAMSEEWQRWKDFKAYLCLSAGEFKKMMRKARKPKIIGTR